VKRLALLLLALGTTPVLVAAKPSASKEQAVIRPLSWEGSATIHAGDQKIDIRVRTRIDAEGNVVSESWPVAQGEQATRRMIIDATGGWMERGGQREPMPKEMFEHERQQFGLYRQLQIAMSRRQNMQAALAGPKLVVGGLVTTRFSFDLSSRPISARNQVSSPDPGSKPIRQIIYFGDLQSVDGFEWPRSFQIYQGGKLYFTLDIEKLEVGAVP
jgi:hypothetical protein